MEGGGGQEDDSYTFENFLDKHLPNDDEETVLPTGFDVAAERKKIRTAITRTVNAISLGTYKPKPTLTVATVSDYVLTLKACQVEEEDGKEELYLARTKTIMMQLYTDECKSMQQPPPQTSAPSSSTVTSSTTTSTAVVSSQLSQSVTSQSALSSQSSTTTSTSSATSGPTPSTTGIPSMNVPVPIQISYAQVQAKPTAFDGSPFSYGPFIKAFEIKYESDPNLPDHDKFFLFKELIGAKGASLINNLNPTAASLIEAKRRCQQHFANATKIRVEARRQFENINPATTERDASKLYSVIDISERIVLALTDSGMDPLLVHHNYFEKICAKFPFSLVNAFDLKSPGSCDVDALLKFAREKADRTARVTENMGLTVHSRSTARVNTVTARPNHQSSQSRSSCRICDGEHLSIYCNAETAARRYDIVVRKKLCLRCIKPGHALSACKSSYICRICQQPHSRVVCTNQTPTDSPRNTPRIPAGGQQSNPVNASGSRPPPQSALSFAAVDSVNPNLTETIAAVIPLEEGSYEPINISDQTRRYLKTVLIKIKGIIVRALLDTGDSCSLILESLAQRLNLNTYGPSQLKLVGVGNGSIKSTRRVTAKLRSIKDGTPFDMVFNTVPSFGTYQLSALSDDDHQILRDRGYDLADVTNEDANSYPIQLIIGTEYCDALWRGLPIRVSSGIYVTETIFGWVAAGTANLNNDIAQDYEAYMGVVSTHTIDTSTYPSFACTELTNIEQQYLDDFVQTKITFVDGSYCVRLPWLEPVTLPTNRNLAHKRFDLMLSHLQRTGLTELFHKEMKQMITHYAERAPSRSTPGRTCVIPLLPVLRPDKETTQVRIVGDFSAHMHRQASLNDNLFKGGNSWNALDLLLRFRFGNQALVADIEKAFLAIAVHPEDRDALRFLWFDDKGDKVEYRFTVVPFGTSASPFLLYAVLQHHLNQSSTNFPDVVELLRRSFYVDDVLCSNAPHTFDLATLKSRSEEWALTGGMTLRKYRTNDTQLDAQWAPQAKPVIKVLGHCWNLQTDTLSLSVDVDRLLSISCMTKRSFASFLASIYDLPGIVTPYAVLLRLFQQQLWARELDWDSPIPDDLTSRATELIQQVRYVNDAKVPRNVLPNEGPAELRIYCDANQQAVGVVAYVHTSNSTLLYYSRATVSERGTVPAMELKALTMAAKCAKDLSTTYPFSSVTIFSDSLLNLQRMNKHPNRMEPALALKISELKRVYPATYRHVESNLNIADVLTKGALMTDLLANDNWWNGPPVSSSTLCEFSVSAITTGDPKDKCTSHSRYQAALGPYRCMAKWMMKTKLKRCSNLVTEQLALILMIKQAQHTHFEEEIKCVEANTEVPNSSVLRKYPRFLDEQGMLRQHTRLAKGTHLTLDQKFPIIMPAHCLISYAIITHEHARLAHAGESRTMEAVRQRYLIFRVRAMTKKVKRTCYICKITQPTIPSIPFGSLPAFRLDSGTPPFTNTGLDLFGPIKVDMKTKGKLYGLILTCATTRAVHLELIPSMTADDVFQAMRRFIALYGIPHIVYSDNGSQLVAIRRRLMHFLEELQALRPDLELRFSWQLQTALSPWRGGFYERLIRSVKSALQSLTFRRKNLTFSELNTILYEIAARINSRPLFSVNEVAFTPAHFFALKPLTQLPPIGNNAAQSITRVDIIDDYIKTQRTINAVSRAHTAHYILELDGYHQSMKQKKPNLVQYAEGDVVLLRNSPQYDRWPLGIVKKVHVSPDECIRTVDVLTTERGTSVLLKNRAIQTLVPLECKNEPGRFVSPGPDVQFTQPSVEPSN